MVGWIGTSELGIEQVRARKSREECAELVLLCDGIVEIRAVSRYLRVLARNDDLRSRAFANLQCTFHARSITRICECALAYATLIVLHKPWIDFSGGGSNNKSGGKVKGNERKSGHS